MGFLCFSFVREQVCGVLSYAAVPRGGLGPPTPPLCRYDEYTADLLLRQWQVVHAGSPKRTCTHQAPERAQALSPVDCYQSNAVAVNLDVNVNLKICRCAFEMRNRHTRSRQRLRKSVPSTPTEPLCYRKSPRQQNAFIHRVDIRASTKSHRQIQLFVQNLQHLSYTWLPICT